MGVRCTLLGHTYGDAEIEREREERGDEAVVTIREVRTCSRCGDRSVVSENKEVTTAVAPDDAGPDAASDSPGAGAGTEDRADAAVQDADADPDATASDPAEEGPEHDPETDDGVILEDEPEEPAEREYGEWPDADEDHASAEADPDAARPDAEPAPWPDSEGEDEGYDAAPPDAESAPDVEYPGSSDEDAGEDAASDDATADEGGRDADGPVDGEATDESRAADEGAEFERARSTGSSTRPATDEMELYCPACGFRDPSRDGSLREGDICPECRKGYLAAGE